MSQKLSEPKTYPPSPRLRPSRISILFAKATRLSESEVLETASVCPVFVTAAGPSDIPLGISNLLLPTKIIAILYTKLMQPHHLFTMVHQFRQEIGSGLNVTLTVRHQLQYIHQMSASWVPSLLHIRTFTLLLLLPPFAAACDQYPVCSLCLLPSIKSVGSNFDTSATSIF